LRDTAVTSIDQSTLSKLKLVSTPTLATALYKRGLRNQMIQGVLPLGPITQTMVGVAMTLRYIPAREDLNPLSVFTDPRHPQRAAIEACPPGAVLVMDSRGDPRAASAGGILVRRLMMRGAAGIVTDGGLRDASGIAALDMPAWCAGASAPTNLIRHHALDINAPIGCGGVPVYPGDIMVGDDDGVVCIPAHLAGEIAVEAVEMERFEQFVLEEVQRGIAIIGLYPPTAPETRERYATWLAHRA
jgi:regulator of RNase E activity RraA